MFFNESRHSWIDSLCFFPWILYLILDISDSFSCIWMFGKYLYHCSTPFAKSLIFLFWYINLNLYFCVDSFSISLILSCLLFFSNWKILNSSFNLCFISKSHGILILIRLDNKLKLALPGQDSVLHFSCIVFFESLTLLYK